MTHMVMHWSLKPQHTIEIIRDIQKKTRVFTSYHTQIHTLVLSTETSQDEC